MEWRPGERLLKLLKLKLSNFSLDLDRKQHVCN